MPTQTIADGLSGIQKASILMMTLGASSSSEVFRFLSDDEIEALTSEIMRTQGVDQSTRDAVLGEFERRCATNPRAGAILELIAED